jgi:hypothetical protein
MGAILGIIGSLLLLVGRDKRRSVPQTPLVFDCPVVQGPKGL